MNNHDADTLSGRKLARATLVLTLLVSVIANVTHAALAVSTISLWLRVPGGILWPVLSFLAIDIVVRIAWRRRFSHYLARVMILGPAIPAIVTSYVHQNGLLKMMGESALIANIGPLAIDGLMIGCTLALLFTRPVPADPIKIAEQPESESIPEPAPIKIESAPEPAPIPAAIAPVIEQARAIVDEARSYEFSAPTTRTRAGQTAHEAARLLQDGQDVKSVVDETGMSAPAVRRYAAVVRVLKQNPHEVIDCRARSVRPDVVESIRAWARLESVR